MWQPAAVNSLHHETRTTNYEPRTWVTRGELKLTDRADLYVKQPRTKELLFVRRREFDVSSHDDVSIWSCGFRSNSKRKGTPLSKRKGCVFRLDVGHVILVSLCGGPPWGTGGKGEMRGWGMGKRERECEGTEEEEEEGYQTLLVMPTSRRTRRSLTAEWPRCRTHLA